ncbi:RidA family protein [Puniceibacterium sp. IMCC21224]|uniref:RidA family protein n=1 Tax=Puniceibacterium sp. IMCC21224 TaxID=1618204 RepID=UPI00064DA3F4|nr:RidA family protein [Puniceibacterium sp. IMCC21224]KMK66498.1 putative translation initiation inhibitor, yjgF family [Puniceibacterium sp. IMCC21224]
MTIKRIYSGSQFEEKIGYARAVVAGGFVHVAGTVGQGDTVEEQCQTALGIIASALRQAGATFSDAVRVTYYLPDAAEFEACWPILKQTFGDAPPAATMVECNLIDPKYRIEIELTALTPV